MTINQEYFRYLKHFTNTVSLQNYFLNTEHSDLVALRHDVDYSLDCALEMAFWESREGFQSTYFLLHTSDYWSDKDFIDKVLQLQDFGHEVGLHNNLISQWFQSPSMPPEEMLETLLNDLRGAGVEVVGTSAHGDLLCYEHQFINYWVFSDLRPENPAMTESGLNAEGIPSTGDRKQIGYPENHTLQMSGQKEFGLWTLSFDKYGLLYEASHLESDGYFTDSGGGWTRTEDPLDADLSTGRHQVLVHPEHWRAPRKIYFFLSTARSGSKWLSKYLDTATSLTACHEQTLNCRYPRESKELIFDKRTGHGFVDLLKNNDEIRQLCIESRNWIETIEGDYGEVNIYLERVLGVLQEVFPEAEYVHLHRDPKDVVRSLMNRDWYEVPEDCKHPVMGVPFWSKMTQFEKVCWYVRLTNESLLELCDKQVRFQDMVTSHGYLEKALESLGIAVYPRLANKCYGSVVNANHRTGFPVYDEWTNIEQSKFKTILWSLVEELDYPSAYASHVRANILERWRTSAFNVYMALSAQLKISISNLLASLNTSEDYAEIDFDNRKSVPTLFLVRCVGDQVPTGLQLRPEQDDEYNSYCVINGKSW